MIGGAVRLIIWGKLHFGGCKSREKLCKIVRWKSIYKVRVRLGVSKFEKSAKFRLEVGAENLLAVTYLGLFFS